MATQRFIIEHEQRIIDKDLSQLDDLWAGIQAERKTNVSRMNPAGCLNVENRNYWSTLVLNLMMAYLKHTQGDDQVRVLALMRELDGNVTALTGFWERHNLDRKGPAYVPRALDPGQNNPERVAPESPQPG